MGNRMEARLLGTSAAWPIPRPGCRCEQCTEARDAPALRRTRSSLRIDTGEEIVLVDVGPDILHQLEREQLAPRVDRVLITHTHPDHFLGLDDLVRVVQRSEPLVVHADDVHAARICEAFPHLSRKEPKIRFERWGTGVHLAYPSMRLEGFECGHRDAFDTTGVLITTDEGRIAYATDMGERAVAPTELLLGVDWFVGDGTYVGAGGYGHPGTDRVARIAADLGARHVAFTHIGHVGVRDVDLRRALGYEAVCYDGEDLLLRLA